MEKKEIINEYEAAMFAANESGYAGMTAEQVIRNLVERAEAAEAKLAELAKQKPVAYEVQLCWDKNGIEKSGTIEFRKTPPSPDESHGLKILRLFTRPAPAADLAELVPDDKSIRKEAGGYAPVYSLQEQQLFIEGATWLRTTILRKIEDAK